MAVFDGLGGAQVAQRPLGDRPALARGEGLGGSQPRRAPIQPGHTQYVGAGHRHKPTQEALIKRPLRLAQRHCNQWSEWRL